MAFSYLVIAAVAVSTATAQCNPFIGGFDGPYLPAGIGGGPIVGGSYLPGGITRIGGPVIDNSYIPGGISGPIISNPCGPTAPGVYGVSLNTYGPNPCPAPSVQLPQTVTPTQRKPTIALPTPPIPAPRVISHICRCTKTVVKPQVYRKVTTVPSVQSYVQTGYTPITQRINYSASPVCGVGAPGVAGPIYGNLAVNAPGIAGPIYGNVAVNAPGIAGPIYNNYGPNCGC